MKLVGGCNDYTADNDPRRFDDCLSSALTSRSPERLGEQWGDSRGAAALLGCVSHQGSSIWSPEVSQVSHHCPFLTVRVPFWCRSAMLSCSNPMKNLFEVLCMALLIWLETQSLHFLWGRPIASQLSIWIYWRALFCASSPLFHAAAC